jgi:exonuclease SbcD
LLLLGNHDLPHALWRANAVEIFDTLSIDNVIVADQPAIYPVKTKNGLVQIVALPWPWRRSQFSREEISQLSFEEINQKQARKLTQILQGLAEKVDPESPAILAAHLSLTNATLSSEQAMILSQEPLLAPSELAKPVFDYVALGHIHKNQVLAYSPPLVYSGSLQRLDFSDEEDPKGFYSVKIISKGKVDFEFHPVKARPFKTIRVDISPQELDPMVTIRQAIAKRRTEIARAIVRIQIRIPQSNEGLIQEAEIYQALKEAQYVSIVKEVTKEPLLRLKETSVKELTPLEALDAYLKLKQFPPQKAKTLMEYGTKLIDDRAST